MWQGGSVGATDRQWLVEVTSPDRTDMALCLLLAFLRGPSLAYYARMLVPMKLTYKISYL